MASLLGLVGDRSVDARELSDSVREPWLPTGAVAQTFDRRGFSASNNSLVSGTLQLAGGLVVPAGRAVSSVSFLSGTTALAAATSQSFYLIDPVTREVVARTVDDGAAGWNASVVKTLALDGGYQPAADVALWVGILVVAGTAPTVAGAALPAGSINVVPLLGGRANSGLTGRLAAGAVINAPTGRAEQAWAFVS